MTINFTEQPGDFSFGNITLFFHSLLLVHQPCSNIQWYLQEKHDYKTIRISSSCESPSGITQNWATHFPPKFLISQATWFMNISKWLWSKMLQFQNVKAEMQVIIPCTTALCPCYAPPPYTHTTPAKQIHYQGTRIINVKRFHLAPGLSLSVFLNLSISFKLQASKLGRYLLYTNSFSYYTATGDALIVIHFGTWYNNNFQINMLRLKLTATCQGILPCSGHYCNSLLLKKLTNCCMK